MVLELTNTLTRRREPFVPREPGVVRMYNCGPTVYNSPHIGNFRSFLLADILRRYLEHRGHRVEQVMNITDVGHMTQDDEDQGTDRMELAAQREKLDPWKIARKYEDEFHEARRWLGIRDAMRYPRATDHVEEMKQIIAHLLQTGHAYQKGGNVYFEIARFPRYGALSGKVMEDLEEGAGGRVGQNPDKKDPRDFALWKVDSKHIMQWDAPWGRGFPGWHIECSAMSMRYLGQELDIHTGGEDNVFPHHECEIAQSEAHTGKPFARHWVHARHLLVDGQKMAKSLGNFITIANLRDRGFSGEEARFALIRVQYNQPLNFTLDGIADARAAIARVQNCRARLVRVQGGVDPAGGEDLVARLGEAQARFVAAMDDDLNVSAALAVVFDLVGDLNRAALTPASATAALATLRGFDAVLGCFGAEPAAASPLSADLQRKAEEREAARKRKDFATADRLRQEIDAAGFKIVDTAQGPRVEKK